MNALSKAKLFATLDTTVIKITIKDIKLIFSLFYKKVTYTINIIF